MVEQVRADRSRCNGPRGNSASGMRPDAIPKLRAGCSSHPGGTIHSRQLAGPGHLRPIGADLASKCRQSSGDLMSVCGSRKH
jgi:hypothetical protein